MSRESVSWTSAAWPRTLLCASNQRLVAAIDELAAQLEEKRQSCNEAKDVVALMRESVTDARRMIAFAEKELASERAAAEKAASNAKAWQLENEKTAKELALWEAESGRLRSLGLKAEEALSDVHQALTAEMGLAARWEDEAKEALLSRLAREKDGEALEAETTRLSSQVWSRLSRLNEEVAHRQLELQGSRDEHAHVLTELDSMHHTLRAAVQDQRATIQALAHVQAESAAADQRIHADGEAMRALKERTAAKTKLRAQLEEVLSTLGRDAKTARNASEAKRAAYDRRLNELRSAVEGLRQLAGATESTQRQRRAEEQHQRDLRTFFANVSALVEERRAGVQQQREYSQQLREAQKSIAASSSLSRAPSPEALLAAYTTLQGQLARWEDRLERARGRVTDAITEMRKEGERGEDLRESLGRAQQQAARLHTEHAVHKATLGAADDRVHVLTVELAKRQERLPELKAASLERSDQQHKQCERRVREMKERLAEATNAHRRLLQANSSLRGGVRRAQQMLQVHQKDSHQQSATEALLMSEVPRLQKELDDLEQRCRGLAEEYATAQLTFASLTTAADGQVSTRKEAAGTEALLRAEATAQGLALESEMQGALVELHLQQAALREQGEELRRQVRRRDLLRSRYTDLMQSLTRAATAPLSEAAPRGSPRTASTSALPSLGPLDEDAPPEALHARLLLQRSFDREQLMARGDYLDMRLVSLDRETATLRGMLHALQQGNVKAPAHQTAAAAVSASASASARRPPGEPAGANPNPAAADERARWMLAEAGLQEEALAAMREQGELSRKQLKSMRKTLWELQAVDRQRRLQLHRLQEQVQRERLKGLQQDGKRLKGVKAVFGAAALS